MTDELKPVRCGCGGEAHHDSASCWNPEQEEWMPNFWHRVICKKCGTQTKAFYTEAEAVQAWNRAMGAKDINVPRKGKWQRRKGSDCWECSECHAVLESDDIVRHNYYYCYHCGADMMNKSGYMDIEEVHYE